jgi:anhydro-N-acetylmuramic acid kinase
MDGPPLVVVGLMSGTSADGIDAAVLTVPPRPDLAAVGAARLHTRAFGAAERAAIFALFDPQRSTVRDVCEMNFRIGAWFAEAALGAIAAAGLSPGDVDVIGSHGQTVFHVPPGAGAGSSFGDAPATPSTLQLGEPSVIAERTGVTTVADFRVRDVAAGGQGAPLVSYVDALLFRHPTQTRAVLNLGGIANVTVLPPLGSASAPIAFDTGPANMVLDGLAETATSGALRCDEDGKLASAGTPDQALLDELLVDPYFAAPPPKTTGRERYGVAYAAHVWQRAQARGLSVEDTLATALALTVETVARAVEASGLTHGTVAEVIAGGGGTRNPTLMAALTGRLPDVLVSTHEAHGVSSHAKEATSFALLAAAAVRGQVNTVPSCTGAGHAVVMGKVVPGANYTSLMRRLFGARP